MPNPCTHIQKRIYLPILKISILTFFDSDKGASEAHIQATSDAIGQPDDFPELPKPAAFRQLRPHSTPSSCRYLGGRDGIRLNMTTMLSGSHLFSDDVFEILSGELWGGHGPWRSGPSFTMPSPLRQVTSAFFAPLVGGVTP